MIGILSDAHGNLPAFQMAIGQLRQRDVSEIYFLGDALGYIPSMGVVDELMLMGESVRCILGNHEELVLREGLDVLREPIYNHQPVRDQLTSKHVNYLESWPTHIQLKHGCTTALLVHGGPIDYTNQYVYPDTDFSHFNVGADFVFMGHTHYPFIKKVGATTYVNVGSCGLPRDDGRYGSAAIYCPESGQVQIIRYDIAAKTERYLQQYSEVHSSVEGVYGRRKATIVGDIV